MFLKKQCERADSQSFSMAFLPRCIECKEFISLCNRIYLKGYCRIYYRYIIYIFVGGGGGVAERLKPLASKQEWNCRAWVRIPPMPRLHMPLISTPPRVSTGMAHFSIMW